MFCSVIAYTKLVRTYNDVALYAAIFIENYIAIVGIYQPFGCDNIEESINIIFERLLYYRN